MHFMHDVLFQHMYCADFVENHKLVIDYECRKTCNMKKKPIPPYGI